MRHPTSIVRRGNFTPIKRTSTLSRTVFAFLFTVGCANPHKSPAPIAITHVNVINATGSAVQPDMTVVIQGEKIAQLAESSRIALDRDAVVVNGSGKFLIPGLVDSHVHLTGSGERQQGIYRAAAGRQWHYHRPRYGRISGIPQTAT
jgi:imidazolonepropionase-like amidohydrolase